MRVFGVAMLVEDEGLLHRILQTGLELFPQSLEALDELGLLVNQVLLEGLQLDLRLAAVPIT